MIDESLLSVGSCVKLNNKSKLIMIAGYLPYDHENKIMYDYIGIYAPVGIREKREKLIINKDYICFKNSDIEKIVFIGYSDNKSEFYREYLLNMKGKLNDMEQELSTDTIKKIMEESLPDIKNIKSEV